MFSEAPLTGTGLGSFNVIATDFMQKYGMTYYGQPTLPFENALNWYVHQLVELGLTGCLAWGLWCVIFLRSVLLFPTPAVVASVLKVLLVGFGFASLFGVHAQNAEILLTFWTLVFWLSTFIPDLFSSPAPAHYSVRWPLMLSIVCVYALSLGFTSMTTLRIAARANSANWEYSYGLYAWEHSPVLGAYRWTHHTASTQLSFSQPRLRLRMKVHHPDVTTNPVKADIWLNDQPAATVWFRDHAPLVQDIALPSGVREALLTIRVSRTWRPADFGQGADYRPLGIALAEWRFLPHSLLPNTPATSVPD